MPWAYKWFGLNAKMLLLSLILYTQFLHTSVDIGEHSK